MDYRVRTHDEVTSTNINIKRSIDAGNPEGLVMMAFRQTGGYGRQGRTWSSPEGGLYFSMLLRPNTVVRKLPTLSLVAALALRRVLSFYVGSLNSANVQIKWPNDVVWTAADLPFGTFAKICGISLEQHGSGVCLGMGVNVFRPLHEQEVGGKNVPTYLSDLLPEGLGEGNLAKSVGPDGLTQGQKDLILRVFSDVLAEFKDLYEGWCAQGIGPYVQEYADVCCLTGKSLRMCDVDGALLAQGEAAGIDESGCLLLRTPEGVVPVSYGEAHLA